MNRIASAVVAFAVVSVVTLSAAPVKVEKYGKPLTVKETTKISDIYASPDKFKDKRVKVEGTIVDVCTDMGCWIAISAEKDKDGKDAQVLRFKVDDGVIVFPTTVKGKVTVAEGVISVTKDADGKVSILLKGEGAEVK